MKPTTTLSAVVFSLLTLTAPAKAGQFKYTIVERQPATTQLFPEELSELSPSRSLARIFNEYGGPLIDKISPEDGGIPESGTYYVFKRGGNDYCIGSVGETLYNMYTRGGNAPGITVYNPLYVIITPVWDRTGECDLAGRVTLHEADDTGRYFYRNYSDFAHR